MNRLKMLGLAAVAVAAFAASAASSASATTLELTGSTFNGTITVTASLEPGSDTRYALTNGSFANTCTESHWHWFTSSFTTPVQAPVQQFALAKCTNEAVVVDAKGSLSIVWISGTTNGTVTSSGTEVTVPSPIGALNCKTGSGTDIGTLTGKSSGQATMDVNAVLNCGFLAPSATWIGSYIITSPHGLGVSG